MSQATRGVLDRRSLLLLLAASPPLVEGLASVEDQVQPNGIDLRVEAVRGLSTAGELGAGSHRRLPAVTPRPFGADGWLALSPGAYSVIFVEAVHLPKGLMALGRPRSTLARCGVSLVTAVWDAGYSGRSEALLVVHNPNGFRLEQGARLMQLVFFPLATPVVEGYQGRYQGENL